jgi:hypothetical protein
MPWPNPQSFIYFCEIWATYLLLGHISHLLARLDDDELEHDDVCQGISISKRKERGTSPHM